jgi:hypothetical protein
MQETLQGAVARIQELPAGHVGRENRLRHAKVRLANVERALAATPGSRPFADGEDRSVAQEVQIDLRLRPDREWGARCRRSRCELTQLYGKGGRFVDPTPSVTFVPKWQPSPR